MHTRLLDAVDPNHNFTTVSEALEAVATFEADLGVLMDSRTAEHHLSSTGLCSDLTVIETGMVLHYALAVPKGSPHKDSLSSLVLRYKETGVTSHLARKWFKTGCASSSMLYPATVHVSNFRKTLFIGYSYNETQCNVLYFIDVHTLRSCNCICQWNALTIENDQKLTSLLNLTWWQRMREQMPLFSPYYTL